MASGFTRKRASESFRYSDQTRQPLRGLADGSRPGGSRRLARCWHPPKDCAHPTAATVGYLAGDLFRGGSSSIYRATMMASETHPCPELRGQPLIGKRLAAEQSKDGVPKQVWILSVVETELEFVEVSVEMLGA